MTGEAATIAVIDALHVLAVPYMLVGSFSSNFYGIPRSTQDADFVLQLGTNPISALAERLAPAFRLDPQMSFETVTGTFRYHLRAADTEFEIELFLLKDDPYDQERFARRRSVRTLGRDVWMPSPEDVIVTKLRWALHARRTKDREDVRDVLAVQGDRLDWDYIHRWCEQHGTRALLDEIRSSIPSI
jgi:hypothetical protein